METTKKLIMSFLTSDDKKVSLSVDNPREDITETEIKSAMDLVVEKNIFAPNGGNIVSIEKESPSKLNFPTQIPIILNINIKKNEIQTPLTSKLLRLFFCNNIGIAIMQDINSIIKSLLRATNNKFNNQWRIAHIIQKKDSLPRK